MSAAGIAGTGYQTPARGNGHYNVLDFIITQFLATVRGAALVQVKACTNTNDLSPIGTVDVQPLVNQLDGASNAVPHGVIPKLPYCRLQGGINGIICDPAVGDIGIAVFADRDGSNVKKTKAQANPGSFRRNDWADGVYIFTVISSAAPTQYVQFTADGMNIADKNGNKIITSASGWSWTDANGNVLVSGSAGLTYNGKNIGDTHMHSGVSTGSGDTGPPV